MNRRAQEREWGSEAGTGAAIKMRGKKRNSRHQCTRIIYFRHIMLLLLMSWARLVDVGEAFRLFFVYPSSFEKNEKIALIATLLTSTKTHISHKYSEAPFCDVRTETSKGSLRPRTLGERIRGEYFERTPYVVTVNVTTNPPLSEFLCHQNLSDSSLRAKWDKQGLKNGINVLEYLIDQDYRINMELDDMRAVSINAKGASEWGWPVGYKVGEDYYIVNHVRFVIYYNVHEAEHGRYMIVGFVVEPYSIRRSEEASNVALWNEQTCENDVKNAIFNKIDRNMGQPLQPEITFSYDIQWEQSYVPWSRRQYDDYKVKGDKIIKFRYISIVQSLAVVLVLLGIVAANVSRVLRKDISSYNEIHTLEEVQKERGWKLVHGDVFHPPQYRPILLCACVGTGLQLSFMFVMTLLMGNRIVGKSSNRHARLETFVFILYPLTGSFTGYCSSRLLKFFHCKNWRMSIVVTTFLFSGFIVFLYLITNIILKVVHATAALDPSNLFIILFSIFFVLAPNTLIGSYFGLKAGIIRVPTRVNQISRHIPKLPWFRSVAMNIAGLGALPFFAVFIETHFVMSAYWLDEPYPFFGLLMGVTVILFITCVEVAILICYYQLSNEDHRWWWKSFLSTGTSSIYLFLYTIWYYFTKSTIVGTAGFVYYFGHMLIVCLAFFLVTGSIGFISSFLFIRFIYSAIKVSGCGDGPLDDSIVKIDEEVVIVGLRLNVG